MSATRKITTARRIGSGRRDILTYGATSPLLPLRRGVAYTNQINPLPCITPTGRHVITPWLAGRYVSTNGG